MNFLVRLHAFCKASDGAALVELALVTPMLAALAIGAADLGRAYYVGLELTNAAHAGAEYGMRNFKNTQYITTANITTAATESAPDVSGLTVAAPVWGCECSDGSSFSSHCTAAPTCTASSTMGNNTVYRIKVTASATYHTLVPWIKIPNTITLSQSATMRGNPD